MAMREIKVIVPPHKSDEVVECFKSDCGIEIVHRTVGDSTHTVTIYATVQASGPILHYLDRRGIGVAYGRVVMMGTNLLKPLPRGSLDSEGVGSTMRQRVRGEHSRIAAEEMWAQASAGCSITSDYLGLIAVAGAIAGLGLATNNTVMIVASMLLSPLMSPILAFTLGTAMRDWVMVKQGLKAELVGLSLCLVVGVVVGCVFAPFSEEFAWPTQEMESRGERTSLLIGLAFAIPSGAGVALSATGSGGSNSLVGVAIAAALLPPVVNAGMCFTFAFIGPRLYESQNFDRDSFLDLSSISFSLFLLNVGVIFLTTSLVFIAKGIPPVRRIISTYQPMPTATTQKERDAAMAAAIPKIEALRAANRAQLEADVQDAARAAAAEVVAQAQQGSSNIAAVVAGAGAGAGVGVGAGAGTADTSGAGETAGAGDAASAAALDSLVNESTKSHISILKQAAASIIDSAVAVHPRATATVIGSSAAAAADSDSNDGPSNQAPSVIVAAVATATPGVGGEPTTVVSAVAAADVTRGADAPTFPTASQPSAKAGDRLMAAQPLSYSSCS